MKIKKQQFKQLIKECLEQLEETILSTHYQTRKEQRGIILDINLPKESYSGYDLEVIKPIILNVIQVKLINQLRKLENKDINSSFNNNVAYLIFSPKIKNKSKIFHITLNTISTTSNSDIEKKNKGDAYVAVIKSNVLITLLINDSKNVEELKNQLMNHDIRNDKTNNKEYIVLKDPDYEFIIDIDELMGNKPEQADEKTNENDIPYKIRTDYRAGAKFEHKQLGTGIIVNTSSGSKGTANSKGIVDWIEVDFGKPYLYKGKLIKTRKFDNIYTTIYFGKQLKA